MPDGIRAGHRTHWTCWGDGHGAPALFIHCSLAHARAWDGVAARLPGLAMTGFDMPGHGQSADWTGQGDYQDVTTAIARSFLQGPTHLIGHSFGATVALRLALEAPELVQSLILIEPVLFAAAEPQALARHERAFAPFVAAYEAGQTEQATRIFTEMWGTGQNWADLSPRQRAYATARIPLVVAGSPATFDDRAETLAPGRLEALDIPVLLLEGAASPPVIAAIQTALQARLPQAEREVIEGAGHMLPVTHPGAVATAIARSLSL